MIKKIFPCIIGLFIILMAVAASCGEQPAAVKGAAAPAYISARSLRMALDGQGYSFDAPYDLDSLQRIIGTKDGVRITILYAADTVRQASIFEQIKSTRESLKAHAAPFADFLSVIDPDAKAWAIPVIEGQDVKKQLDQERDINRHHYMVNYTPDVDLDALNLTYYHSAP